MTKNVRRNYKLIRRKGKDRWDGGKKIKIGVRGKGRGKETLCGGLNGERAEREKERQNEGNREIEKELREKGKKVGKAGCRGKTKEEEEK